MYYLLHLFVEETPLKPSISLHEITFVQRAGDITATGEYAFWVNPAVHQPAARFVAAYREWLSDLRPRTCLLVQWLVSQGALADPGHEVREKARRFATKSTLLGRLVDGQGGPVARKVTTLLHAGDFEIYVAWLLWMRVEEYVPGRFLLPGGREKVLQWVREQLRRPELTPQETLRELWWHADRIRTELGDHNDFAHWLYDGSN
jgi:hypothetical protein